MSDIAVALILVAVVNPARARLSWPVAESERPRASRVVAMGSSVVAGAGLVLAAASGPILDALAVSLPTFRTGAGIVMLAAGLRLVVAGPSRWEGVTPSRRTALVPVAFPILFTPELAAAAISYGADHGVAATVVGVLAGLALAVAVFSFGTRPNRAAGGAVALGAGRFAAAVVTIAGVLATVGGILDL